MFSEVTVAIIPSGKYNDDWDSWIRTSKCSSQSAVPYHLAIPHQNQFQKSIPNRSFIAFSYFLVFLFSFVIFFSISITFSL